jgi:MoaA/NifB/PqqE/SkfB family radical SAM enzyme
LDNLILDGHKLSWHMDRVKAWQNGEKFAPITIDCALTRRCTYRCIYCYSKLQANDEKKLTKEFIFRFLDDAAEIGVKAISFVSDGESTCSPYIYDAILYAKENGLDVALGTNGYLLKKNRLKEILPALTYLRFNISAADPEKYGQIHGCTEECFAEVGETISKCVSIKIETGLEVTIGLQMVLIPESKEQVIPLANLGLNLGVDYLVIKHCSDDEFGTLGIDYDKYEEVFELLREAEAISTERYLVKAKWSKLLCGTRRSYSRCYGPPFILQMSGSGLVAPCGMLFNNRYRRYHIGNITENRFKDIWKSERYWNVMNLLASDQFDAKTMCGTLCLQHKVNEFLDSIKKGKDGRPRVDTQRPSHVNFI